jgi:hypothetical protein
LSPALRRPTRPPGRSRHARYVVATTGDLHYGLREHDLIAFGQSTASIDSVVEVDHRWAFDGRLITDDCDTYGHALLHYGHALGLRERLAGLHQDLVRATARDLARTLGMAVRIEVIEEGRATITHSIDSVAAELFREGVFREGTPEVTP